jgi:hypothetical protein
VTLRPGLILAAVFLALYGTFALTADVPRASYGFHSDEATYYMMAWSLVDDGDLTYTKDDLVRVWKEFSSGPSGVFLKRGSTLAGRPDPNPYRYYYGKAFIYPVFAAPFVLLFGTNGFLVLNALCLALVLLCGYLFLHARAGPWPSAILAAGFVMASAIPVYFAWIMPEAFNFSLAFVAYFCWLYKEVAAPARSPKGTAWLFTPRADLAAATLLGIATFSKPTNALLFVPIVCWELYKRRWRIGGAILVFTAVAAGLFAINIAITGEWNYQGGDRKSYYVEFPFQNDVTTRPLGVEKSRENMLPNVIFNKRTFASNLLHNLEYFFVGRYAGMIGYFFPAFFAMIALLAGPSRRPGWQWIVLASGLAQGLIFVVATPYTWSGGGVGNRYFASGYGVMLFALPPIESIALSFVPWVIGGLFVAPMVLDPFAASFRPYDNAKHGPLRLLPVELTLLNDLPVWTDGDRARVWFGDLGKGDPGFLVSFLDNNAYNREADKSFWTRGGSRADLVFKADRPIRRAIFDLTAGAVPVDVSINLHGKKQFVHLDPGATQQIAIAMPAGVAFEKEVAGVRVWNVSIETSAGFTPIFYDSASTDVRYLGVRVKPMLEAAPAAGR